MKLRQISFKIISLVMVFAMMFGMSATTISAFASNLAETETTETTDKIYVSLGDSMTNGYGLPGYDYNSGVEDYGNGSYANQFAQWLGATKHYQLAMSAMRAEDLHWLLEFDYNNPEAVALTEMSEWNEEAWNAVFTNGDYWTWNEICTHGRTRSTTDSILATGYTAYPECYNPINKYTNDVALIAKYYQEAVVAADVMSLGMGNGNFGVFMFGRILEAIGFNGEPSDALVYNVESAIRELEPEMQAKVLELKAELDKVVADYIASDDNNMAAETVEVLANTVVYTAISYVLNYAGTLEAMLQLNSDAEIILVALMNTFANKTEVEGLTIGDLLEVVFTPLNIFIAALPTYMQATENGVYADATFYYAEAENVECLVDVYGDELENEESVIRARFVESIVGTEKNPGMVWDMLSYDVYPTLAEIEEFESYKVASNKVAYAQSLGADKTQAVLTYLAFEAAIVKASEGAPVSISSVLGLGTMDTSAFDEIFKTIEKNTADEIADSINNKTGYWLDVSAIVKNQLRGQDFGGVNAHDFLFKGIEAYNVPATYKGIQYLLKDYLANGRDAVVAKVSATLALVSQADKAEALVDGVWNGYTGAYTVLCSTDIIYDAVVESESLAGLLSLFARCVIGNGLGGHPSQKGHDTLFEAVKSAYKNNTAKDQTIANLIQAAKDLNWLVEEYHDEAYAEAYAQLKAEGYIDAAIAGVDEAIKAVEDFITLVDGIEVDADLVEAKADLLAELEITLVTLEKVKVVLGNEVLDEKAWNDLADLADLLLLNLENVADIAAQLAVVAADRANVALMEAVAELQVYVVELHNSTVAELKLLAKEVSARVYAHIVEKTYEVYGALVDALVDGLKFHSHEAAKLAYYWLLNNPETVIEFFDTYGDDMVEFIADNHVVIGSVLGFVALTYGEDILYLVLDNADVILPAIVDWFEIHGDLVWDLLVVYFNAIVEYYNLGIEIDFSSPEGIHITFVNIFELLGQLLDMIKDGVYDYLEALGIMEQIEYQLAKLDAHIRGQIEDAVNALEAHVQEKIAAITAQINAQIAVVTAQINAQIDVLKTQLETAVGEARDQILAEIARLEALLDSQVAALKAELEALVNAEINSLEDAKAALDLLLQKGVKALGEYIYASIAAFVEDAITGKFTPTEDTDYVSVNGGSADYADLLAGMLSEKLDSPINLDKMDWSNLDYDKLAAAELITIGFDENELSAFAVSQLIAYVTNYVDTDIRNNTNAYINDVFTVLNKTLHELVDGKFNVDFDFEDYKAPAFDAINGTIDEILGYELIAGYELEEMDWAKYVGAENLHYVDEARASLKAEILNAGVMETFTYTIDVVDYLYANAEDLGIADALNFILKSYAYEVLGDAAYYTVEVPVADALTFAAESYLYGNVEFQAEYGQLIVDLYEINPEAVIILLGHYNAYDYELVLGDLEINLGDAYGYVAGVSSLQPFAYALLSGKIAYVDIYEAETVFESLVAAGVVENTLLNFVMMYLADSSITDASEAGNEYIYNQILNILTVGCDHKYDNACDDTCNKCGAHREVPGHVYDNACDATCNECGAVRVVGDHEYVDGVCIHCGHKLPVAPPAGEGDGPTKPNADCLAGKHTFDDCDDTQCNKCDYTRAALVHVYSGCADTTCDNCNKVRVAPGHVYANGCDATCDRCGETRKVDGHVYSGCTDTDCNVCGEKRTAGAHVVDDCTDTDCNVCGQNVAANGHKFGDWTVTVEATRKNDGEKCRVCSICNLKETKAIAAFGGISGGAIAGIVVGSTAVAGAAGFAIYWFLIQKKTFAALVEGVKKLFGGAAAPAAAPAQAPAAKADAPSNED